MTSGPSTAGKAILAAAPAVPLTLIAAGESIGEREIHNGLEDSS